MAEIKTKIPAEMEPAAVGGMVADAKYIIDRVKNKNQTEVNTEVGTEITNIKGGSSKSIANLDSRLGTVEQLAEISIGGGDAQIATGSDFTNPDATKRAKVPTVGAVLDGLNDGIYDVSKRNPTAGPNSDGKFTLDYILSNADTLIPTGWRHGGMTISFVDSSDNKYVQARCMAQNFTTNVTQWQGVDDEPTANSNNLVTSGGVASTIQPIKLYMTGIDTTFVSVSGYGKKDIAIDVKEGEEMVLNISNYNVTNTSAKAFLLISPSDLSQYEEVSISANGTYSLYANRDYHYLRFYKTTDAGSISMDANYHINQRQIHIEQEFQSIRTNIETIENDNANTKEKVENISIDTIGIDTTFVSVSGYGKLDIPIDVKEGEEVVLDVSDYAATNTQAKAFLLISPSDLSEYKEVIINGNGTYSLYANRDYHYIRFYKTQDSGSLSMQTNWHINKKLISDVIENVYQTLIDNSNRTTHIKLLGDSITQGSGSTGYVAYTRDVEGSMYYVRGNGPDYPDKWQGYEEGDYLGTEGDVIWYEATSGNGWGNLLQRSLEASYNCVVKNYGMGGITSSGILSRLDTLLSNDDDVIILMIGTNDTLRTTANTYKQNLFALVEKIKNVGKQLIVMAPPPAMNETSLSWRKNDVCNIARYVCKITRTAFVPLYDIITNYVMTSNDELSDLLPDGLHPNDKLYNLMYYWVSQKIGLSERFD